MKCSDLIRKLQDIMSERGDLDCFGRTDIELNGDHLPEVGWDELEVAVARYPGTQASANVVRFSA